MIRPLALFGPFWGSTSGMILIGVGAAATAGVITLAYHAAEELPAAAARLLRSVFATGVSRETIERHRRR